MAISNSSGVTSVTGNVSVSSSTAFPSAAATQTLVTGTYLQSVGGNQETVRTTTAGKTFYLMGYYFTNANGTAQGCYIFSHGGTILTYFQVAANGQSAPVCSTIPLMTVAASQNLVVRQDATNMRFTYWGYEA